MNKNFYPGITRNKVFDSRMILPFPSPVEQPLEFLLAYHPDVAERNGLHRAAGRKPGKVGAFFLPLGSRQLIMCLVAIDGAEHYRRGRSSRRICFRKHVDFGRFGDKRGANQQGVASTKIWKLTSGRTLIFSERGRCRLYGLAIYVERRKIISARSPGSF